MTAPTSALERVIKRAGTRRQAAEERCELCSVPVPPGHRHLLDTEDSVLMCVCQPCSLLFSRDTASEGHYRLVPLRRTRLGAVPTKDLGVPVGLAYFVPRGDGAVVAHYPSPAGATQWEVDPQAWVDVVDHCPTLRTLAPDVEALLVNTARGGQHHCSCRSTTACGSSPWYARSGRAYPAAPRYGRRSSGSSPS